MEFAREYRTNCPSCGGALGTRCKQIRDHASGVPFEAGRCSVCGLTFLVDPPAATELGRFYAEGPGAQMHNKPSPLVTRARDAFMQTEVRRLSRFVPDGATVADVGSGDGSFAMLLKRKGFNPLAVDVFAPNRWSISQIPYAQYDPASPDSDILPADATIDAVVMRHVLEHVLDPAATLRQFASRGVKSVFVVVPNVESRLAGRLGSDWYFWDPPRHITFFAPRTLTSLADNAGYAVADLTVVGLDELVTSAHRHLLLSDLGAPKSPLRERAIAFTRPLGMAAAASSAAVAPFGSATIKAVLQLQ